VEYLEAINCPAFQKANGYYHHGRMRIERLPLGNPHSRDHYIASQAVGLFAALTTLVWMIMITAPIAKPAVMKLSPLSLSTSLNPLGQSLGTLRSSIWITTHLLIW
jgi:hypothetical protein